MLQSNQIDDVAQPVPLQTEASSCSLVLSTHSVSTTSRILVKLCTLWLANKVVEQVVRLHSLGVGSVSKPYRRGPNEGRI